MSELPVQNETPEIWVDADGMVHADRRRPGRRQHIVASLIPLLRSEKSTADFLEVEADSGAEDNLPHDSGSFGRGLAYSVAVGVVFWAGVAYLVLYWP